MPKKFRRKGKKSKDKKQDKAIKKLVRQVGKPEYKELVHQAGAVTYYDNTMQGLVLTDIAEGTTVATRNGRKIRPMGLQWTVVFTGSAIDFVSQLDPPNATCRFLIIQDKTYDNAFPPGSAILESYVTTDASMSSAISTYNTDFIRTKWNNCENNAIKILHDSGPFSVVPLLSHYAGIPSCQKIMKGFIHGSQMTQVSYDGTGSGDSRAGTIYALWIAGNRSTANKNAGVSYNFKLSYVDN